MKYEKHTVRVSKGKDFRNTEEHFEKSNMEEILNNEKQSISPGRVDLFELIFGKIPHESWEKPFSSIPNLIGFILNLILIPLLFVFLPYCYLLFTFQEILEKYNIKAFPYSRSKKERFAFLIISTLAALTYLPIFYWMAFTKYGETSPTILRIVFGTVSSAMVVLFVLSEWFSFFLTNIWRRSIQRDLDICYP